jgi:pimeloyl-ACP methyl ester carboxylesterase
VAKILLVHGAFGGSWAWKPVLPGLRAAGHDADAIDLPGGGDDPTPIAQVTLDAYAERICSTLAGGPPAVLVGQSMGGMAITQAAARCPGSVMGLIYTAAFLPAEGQSLIDLTALPEGAGDQVQANLVVEGDPPVAIMPPEAAKHALYNCCDDDKAAWAAAQLGPQAIAAFTGPIHIDETNREAFERLPRAYVTCLQDHAIPPALQRRMFTAAGCYPVVELDTDHAPWLSRTDELVAAIDTIASALDASGLARSS